MATKTKAEENGVADKAEKTQAVWAKFADARKEMKARLVERDEEIDVVLTALLAKAHPLLVGPPGTGKSMLLDALVRWTGGSKPFNILFTKFTTPEEVFGPVSIKGLKEDRYVRVTAGKLPEAEVALCDEIFKASSAILNTMLRILNERVYEDGAGGFRPCPLLICLAASNEWPGEDGGKELGALFDRFLFRKVVRPIRTEAGMRKLLWGDDANLLPDFTGCRVSSAEVTHAIREAEHTPWTKEAQEAMWAVLKALRADGIVPGDRRVRKSVRAAQAFAWLEGADEVLPEHLEVLAHTLWDDPREQPDRCAKVVSKIANPTAHAVTGKLLAAEDVVVNGTPIDAVPKLQAIEKELRQLPAGPKVDKALRTVRHHIKAAYTKVVGEE